MMLTPERRAKALEVLRAIREDIPHDITELDGKPFTGRTVAKAHANLAAQVDTMAAILIEELSP